MTKRAPSRRPTIVGEPLPNIPWQDRPAGCESIVWRHDANPIIGLHPFPTARSVYNSCVIPYEGSFAGVFRVDWLCMTPYLHTGRSKDGLAWTIDPEPIRFISPDPDLGEVHFAYDPRLVRIEDRTYVTWCNTYHGSTIGVAWTTDFETFHQLENAFLPFNRNGVLFPRKIGGKYAMLSRPMGSGAAVNYGDIFYSESPNLVHWGRHRIVLTRGPRKWERVKIGAGPAPIETAEGWLMLYHGVSDTCDGFVYCWGAALLDPDEPWRVRYRCRFPLMSPETLYETTGYVGNVVFPTAVLTDAPTGRMAIYYGAADTGSAVAYAQVDELIEYVKANAAEGGGDRLPGGMSVPSVSLCFMEKAAMPIHRSESDLPTDAAGRHTGNIIDAAAGATRGFCLGVGYYDAAEFGKPGVHDDQEAIYVLEGTGTASVGGQEFPVRPGTAFYVAPGVPHTIRRDRASGPVKVLWTHGAI